MAVLDRHRSLPPRERPAQADHLQVHPQLASSRQRFLFTPSAPVSPLPWESQALDVCQWAFRFLCEDKGIAGRELG